MQWATSSKSASQRICGEMELEPQMNLELEPQMNLELELQLELELELEEADGQS